MWKQVKPTPPQTGKHCKGSIACLSAHPDAKATRCKSDRADKQAKHLGRKPGNNQKGKKETRSRLE